MLTFTASNTILYCQAWAETVTFYRDLLALPVTFANDWFVEFQLTDTARISVADERQASVKSAYGDGITLALQVANADTAWQWLRARGVDVGPLRDHAWGARVFYFHDPEGHRLEVWAPFA